MWPKAFCYQNENPNVLCLSQKDTHMTRLTPLALATLAMLSVTACVANNPSTSGYGAPNEANSGTPPAGKRDAPWLSPNGCTYISAQAPGYAPTWHLVVNGERIGMTNSKKGCEVVIQGSE